MHPSLGIVLDATSAPVVVPPSPSSPIHTHAKMLDGSNFTKNGKTITPADVANWVSDQYEMAIFEAFPPFAPYTDKYDLQCEQMSVCAHGGMDVANFIYDYLDSPWWRDGCLQGIAQATSIGVRPAFVAADQEDTTAKSLTLSARIDAVKATRAAIKSAGWWYITYTGYWFWVGYMGNQPILNDDPLWDSHYDGAPDAAVDFISYGGWVAAAMKQWAGTSTLAGVANVDLDVSADVITQNTRLVRLNSRYERFIRKVHSS